MVAMVAIDGRTRIASPHRPTRGSRVDIRVAPRPWPWNRPVPGWLPHAPDARTRGAKLVACAAEGGSESARGVRSTWARARARVRAKC